VRISPERLRKRGSLSENVFRWWRRTRCSACRLATLVAASTKFFLVGKGISVVAPHSLLGLSPRDARCGIHQIFPCRKCISVVAPHSLLGLSPRDARCGIHQIFPCRKILVEVGGIEPPSLSIQIKGAPCLVYPLRLLLSAPVNGIRQAAAFNVSPGPEKANQTRLFH